MSGVRKREGWLGVVIVYERQGIVRGFREICRGGGYV